MYCNEQPVPTDGKITDPYEVLAQREPLVAVAIHLAQRAGRGEERSSRFENESHRYQKDYEEAASNLSRAERSRESYYEGLVAARETIAKLEKKLPKKPAKKTVKKARK